MEYPKPQITIEGKAFDLLSYDEFREARGLHMMANASIVYNFDNDSLDFTIIGNFRYIVWNNKAKNFNLLIRKPNLRALAAGHP